MPRRFRSSGLAALRSGSACLRTIWAELTATQFQVYDRSLTPEFVTSLILRSLKRNAEEHLGARLPGVVAGYPATFSIAQHNALAAAFPMAEIYVGRFIGEPSGRRVPPARR
jgi:molecular chaperone DnaK (HSP70)